MEDIIGFVLIVISLIINILAVIISGYSIIYLIWHEWRLRDVNLLLVINTYIPVLFASVMDVVFNIQTILGDNHLLHSTDSTGCLVTGYIYIYMSMWLFDSFSIQAYIRMLNILNPNRTYLRSFMATMIFIGITWFATLLLLLPTIFLKAVTYQSNEYECMTDLGTWKGNIYMLLSVYSIPITITVITYVRVVKFMKVYSLRTQQRRNASLMRDVMVLRRVAILVCTLIALGLPSAILWIQGLIVGHLHPLAYRIQTISVAITMFIFAITIALINPQVKRLLPLLNKQNTIGVTVIQPQQQLGTMATTRQR